MLINVLNNIVIKMGIFLVSFYIFTKTINYNVSLKQKIFFSFWCFIWTILNIPKLLWSPLLYNMIYCTATIFFSWKVLKINFDTTALAYILSYGLSNFLYFMANTLVGLIFVRFLSNDSYNQSPVDFNNPIYLLIYILIASVQFIMAYRFFKIKRYKDGFPFLLRRYAVILTLIITGIVVIIASMISFPREIYDYSYIILISGIIITGIGTIIGIRKGITIFYIKKIKERSIEQLEQELLDAEKEMQRLIRQNELLRKGHHKFSNRLSSLEKGVTEIIQAMKSGNHSIEISEEFAVTLNDITRLSRERENDISQIKKEKYLPLTKIKGLDNMFDYFSTQCANTNIDFNLIVNGSIVYLVENIIGQSDLETMIGDLLKNALIAVNANDKTYRNVLAVIGLSETFYEFTVFDSGIPFEITTLAQLGKERVTTYADAGGSGFGFMITFETMKKCGASLIINENLPNEYNYTKSVTVRFDGKNQYLIQSCQSGNIFRCGEEYIVI